MVTTGKTIAGRRARPESDSERERVRKQYRKRKIVSVILIVGFLVAIVYLSVRAFQEWYKWISNREEIVTIEKEPNVEVIDERTGTTTRELSSRIKEYIANLEEEFALLGYNVVRVRIPADKAREVDVELEGVSGVVKVSTDRNAAVSAEDGARMVKYLKEQGVEEFSYIDVRVERKGFWK